MANGLFGGGDGSKENPFLIEDAEDLDAMRHNLNSQFKLVSDINLGAPPFHEGEGWNPIDNFTGMLDGNWHTVYNLYINRPLRDNVGLFGYSDIPPIDSANMIIQNLAIENLKIIGHDNIGTIIGQLSIERNSEYISIEDHIHIKNIHISGTIKGNMNVGGFVGFLNTRIGNYDGVLLRYGFLENCSIKASIKGTENVGGLTGFYKFDYFGNGIAKFYHQRCIVLCRFSSKNYSITTGGYSRSRYAEIEKDRDIIFDKSIIDSRAIIQDEICGYESTELKSGNIEIYEKFYNLKDNFGERIFSFIDGEYPQAAWINKNCFYVKIGDYYYTFDTKNKQWIKQFDKIFPVTTQIRNLGMTEISSIRTNDWNSIIHNKDIEIVNILSQNNIICSKLIKEKLLLSETNKATNKKIMRKKYNFADYNNEIVNISPA